MALEFPWAKGAEVLARKGRLGFGMRLRNIEALMATGGLALWCAVAVIAATVPVLAQDVPSSRRSAAAIERVRPGLARDLAAKGLRLGSPIYLRIFKRPAELEVWVEGEARRFHLFRTYPICDFSGKLGPKLREGDFQSPEGFYYVRARQLNPSSRFHLSFNLGFPNAYDRAHGRTGSYLMVHGNCVSVGCYAMTDPGIEEIYALADAAFGGGQPFFRVHVFPFRMTDANMEIYGQHRWIPFWRNLKQGYDFFAIHMRPPNVRMRRRVYLFERDQGSPGSRRREGRAG